MLQENSDFIIQTKGLSKKFKRVQALDSLTLNVKRNSIFGFLGPNGAGKTTMIKLLLGLITPSSGSATIFGKDIVKDSVAIRSRIGYLPQPPCFYEHMTARQVLRYAIGFYIEGPKNAIEKRIDYTLDMIGLSDKADRRIKGFSGGELQRLGIGQAQIHNPDLLILDEPAAALDPMGRRDVLKIMEELREHTTIFFSTHILNDVQKIGDYVAIMNHGKLVSHGLMNDFINGNGETVYSIRLKGNTEDAFTRISKETWVSRIDVSLEGGETHWLVNVVDQKIAENKLLSLILANGNLQVTNWGKKTYELESVFMDIIEEE